MRLTPSRVLLMIVCLAIAAGLVLFPLLRAVTVLMVSGLVCISRPPKRGRH